MTKSPSESKFLDALGIRDAEQDEVDLEYLKDVHWDVWSQFSSDYEKMTEFMGSLVQQLGETKAQHDSETSAFGDSWPGAQIEMAELREQIAMLDRTMRVHPEFPKPPYPIKHINYRCNDLPF